MAYSIAKANISVGANSAELTKGLGVAKSEIRQFTSVTRKQFAEMGDKDLMKHFRMGFSGRDMGLNNVQMTRLRDMVKAQDAAKAAAHKATEAIAKDGKGMADGLSKAISGSGGSIAGLATSLGGLAVTCPEVALVVAGIGFAAAQVAAPFIAMGAAITGAALATEHFFQESKKLQSIGRIANSLAIDPSALMGLTSQFAKFDVAGEATSKMLNKLGAKLVDAKFNGGELAATLVKLNIPIDELLKLPADEKLYRMSDALASMKNPAQQAKFAMLLFEEEGTKLLPLLQQGGSAMKSQNDQLRKLGVSLSQVDMQKINMAMESWKGFGDGFIGMAMRMTTAFSPVLEALGHQVMAAMEKAQPAIDWFIRGFGEACEITGALVEILGPQFIAGIEDMINEARDLAFEFMGWSESMGLFKNNVSTVEQYTSNVFKAMSYSASDFWVALKGGAKANSGAFGMLIVAITEVAKAFVSATRTIIEVGAKLPEFPGFKNPFRGALESLNSFDGGLDDLHAKGEKMMKWGPKDMFDFEGGRTEVDRMFESIEAMREARNKSAAERAKAQDDKNKLFNGTSPELFKQFQYQPVGAASFGSRDAASTLARFETGLLVKPETALMRQQLAAQNKQLDETRKLVEATQRSASALKLW
jgi:hypothetical protein